ncbi:MAG: EndoU domain-containing protein [Lachnospiraceae bacterium]|nr:EndoU domain-containing protein [Lachnospiraceae bacterium]
MKKIRSIAVIILSLLLLTGCKFASANEYLEAGGLDVKVSEKDVDKTLDKINDTADMVYEKGSVIKNEIEVNNEARKASDETGKDDEEDEEFTEYKKADLDNLQNTENFAWYAIDHIFNGEINDSGKAVGYHYDGISDSDGEIIEGSKTAPDENGVYTAKVRVAGVDKTSNKGYSSFYPEKMSPQDVVDAINEAYENKEDLGNGLYAGLTDDGIEIDMYLNSKGKIKTAYPVKED